MKIIFNFNYFLFQIVSVCLILILFYSHRSLCLYPRPIPPAGDDGSHYVFFFFRDITVNAVTDIMWCVSMCFLNSW